MKTFTVLGATLRKSRSVGTKFWFLSRGAETTMFFVYAPPPPPKVEPIREKNSGRRLDLLLPQHKREPRKGLPSARDASGRRYHTFRKQVTRAFTPVKATWVSDLPESVSDEFSQSVSPGHPVSLSDLGSSDPRTRRESGALTLSLTPRNPMWEWRNRFSV